MKKKFLFIYLLMLISLSASAQKIFNWWEPRDENIDSLKRVLPFQKDTSRINTLNNLCYAYSGLQKDSSIAYAAKAYREAVNINYTEGIIVSLFYKSQLAEDLDKAKNCLQQAIALGLKSPYARGTGLSCTQLAWLYCTSGKIDSSFAMLSVADSLALRNKDGLVQLVVNQIRGVDYFTTNRMYEALQTWTKSNPLIGKYLGDEGIANNLHQIGRIYAAIDDQQQAVYYLRQSIEYRQQHHQTGDWGNFTEIADSYMLLSKPDSALYFINKGIALADSLPLDSMLRENIKQEQFIKKTGILITMKNYDEAKALVLPLYQKFDKENNLGLLTATLPKLEQIYYFKKDYSNALLYGRRFMQLMKENDWTALLSYSYRLLSDVFGKLNMNDSAYYYLHAYNSYKDTIHESNVNNNITFYKTMTENEANQSRIQLLGKENEIKQQKLNMVVGFFIGVVLLATVTFYLVALKRKNEKQLRELAENELRLQKLKSEKTKAELEQQKAELHAQAVQAQVNELLKLQQLRAQIAADLHDDIGSTLTSISYYSELVKLQLKNDSLTAKPLLDKIGNSARNTALAMNDIIWVINPGNDDTSGLVTRMKNLAAEMLNERNIFHLFQTNPEIETVRFNMEQRKNLYLIYKEALHNVVKYAHCDTVVIKFKLEGNCLILNICDNGKGFETNSNGRGNGLLNMKRRAAEVNAQIEIESAENKGTHIKLICHLT